LHRRFSCFKPSELLLEIQGSHVEQVQTLLAQMGYKIAGAAKK
jgi:translation initiation factor 1 (eIF-1/SUI1)